MRRSVAVTWHAAFAVAAGVLYFFFVLPRWWELMGETSHTLGTVLRIVGGALIGLAALPVVFTLLRTRRPEFRTPQLALSLRFWSIVLHVLAGLLIIGAAVSEIWLNLDSAGRWLFGVYGAAAAIALLGVLAFYLAFVAELPPPPPKPLKPKAAAKKRRGRKRGADEAAEETTEDTEAAEQTEAEESTELAPEPAADADDNASDDNAAEEQPAEEATTTAADPAVEDSGGRLRNRRPSGNRRRRLRGGVAVED
jgi:MFS family permease